MTQLDLGHGQSLLIDRDAEGSTLHLLAPDGVLGLRIRITAAGPILELDGGCAVRVGGDLEIEAERLRLHGRSAVAISSGGDLHTTALGDHTATARHQELRADPGEVRIRANDDIKLNGERILMNL